MRSLFIALLMTAACSEGAPTGAVCPPTNPPTYAAFGQPFFATYCTSCHSANATNRHGAPRSQNYDTEADVVLHAAEIDEVAAKGPGGTNTSMPKLGGTVTKLPSDAEREMLGVFLACVMN